VIYNRIKSIYFHKKNIKEKEKKITFWNNSSVPFFKKKRNNSTRGTSRKLFLLITFSNYGDGIEKQLRVISFELSDTDAVVSGCIQSDDKSTVYLFTDIKGKIVSSPWVSPKLTI